MLNYKPHLKSISRELRNNTTAAEKILWSKLRGKQVMGIQFYRQKPLAGFIADFYCAAARLVIELDGSQHLEPQQQAADSARTESLEAMHLKVLRFDNRQVMTEIDGVMAVVFDEVSARIALR